MEVCGAVWRSGGHPGLESSKDALPGTSEVRRERERGKEGEREVRGDFTRGKTSFDVKGERQEMKEREVEQGVWIGVCVCVCVVGG